MIITADVDMSRFSAGVRGLIRATRLNSRVVVAKETGELIKTLVKVSPPREPKKTRESIKTSIAGRFTALSENAGKFDALNAAPGKTGIKWYAANEKFLFGAAPDSDMRRSSVETLRKVFYRIKTVQGSKRIIVGFKKARRVQRVAIATQLLIKKAQHTQLAARIAKNIGRLKAAWMVAVTKGKIKISGANMPPQMVTRHAHGARGMYVDGLNADFKPTFAVINQAKGIGQRQVGGLVQMAVGIRAKAMAKNALLFMSGKKKVGDYA